MAQIRVYGLSLTASTPVDSHKLRVYRLGLTASTPAGLNKLRVYGLSVTASSANAAHLWDGITLHPAELH